MYIGVSIYTYLYIALDEPGTEPTDLARVLSGVDLGTYVYLYLYNIYIYIYMYVYICMYVSVSIYSNLYIALNELGTEPSDLARALSAVGLGMYIYIYMYIYIISIYLSIYLSI